jgi:predicted metal-dependent phosphoesterase TrpH
MILDLHVHSIYSQDSPVEPEEYAQTLLNLQDQYRIDGFVLMEHRIYVQDMDFNALGQKYGIIILNGTEAETTWGHLLIYGVTQELLENFPLDIKHDPVPLATAVHQTGGLAVPAHPFRGFVSMGIRCVDIPYVQALEVLNGSNSEDQNQTALMFARKFDLAQTGGSDAHFVRELGLALTEFKNPIKTMADLVREIKAKRCRPITLEQARLNF